MATGGINSDIEIEYSIMKIRFTELDIIVKTNIFQSKLGKLIQKENKAQYFLTIAYVYKLILKLILILDKQ